MAQGDLVVNRPALAALAVIAWAGVLLQFWLSLKMALENGKSASDGVVVFLGYFTVLSNMFVSFAATLPLMVGNTRIGRWLGKPVVLGCAVTSIVTVGVGYHLLLRNVWNPQGLQLLADVVLHYVVPISALAYWVAFPPRAKLSVLAPIAWCLYPICYGAYALLRGELLGSYPYHFMDVSNLGYRQVLINLLGLLACFIGVGAAVLGIAVLRNRLYPGKTTSGGNHACNPKRLGRAVNQGVRPLRDMPMSLQPVTIETAGQFGLFQALGLTDGSMSTDGIKQEHQRLAMALCAWRVWLICFNHWQGTSCSRFLAAGRLCVP